MEFETKIPEFFTNYFKPQGEVGAYKQPRY